MIEGELTSIASEGEYTVLEDIAEVATDKGDEKNPNASKMACKERTSICR